jgi:hypothetical protein
MHTELENSTYESAYEALLFCKMYLEEKGQVDAASYLEGLDPVCDQLTGRVARGRLVAAQRRISDSSAQHIVTLALNAIDRALHTPVLLATG